jgi:hypothetical protein
MTLDWREAYPMRRRDLLGLLGGAAGIWPFAGAAQQPKVPTIGVLVVGSPGSQQFWRLFREAMRELDTSTGKASASSSDRTKDRQAAFQIWQRSWCGSKSI